MKTRALAAGVLCAMNLAACDHHSAPAVTEAPAQFPAAPSTTPAEKALPVPNDSAPVTNPAPPRGKRAPCTTDQSCNGDPSVSALWGRCVKESGVCECNVGFELHPGGSCQPIAK
ncbi:MAG: hypothetical protein ABIQ16_28450 [Polyangiaceae bacterium]